MREREYNMATKNFRKRAIRKTAEKKLLELEIKTKME
jgi:hypothetical protein